MQPTKLFGLGGMEEIGKSSLVIEDKDSIVIIDAGIKFADTHTTGIKGILPDYTYLKERQSKIKGLFITHGHEDHIGGIPYLVRELNVNTIYAPKIAIQYLRAKLQDQGVKVKVNFEEIEKDAFYDFGDLKVDFWTAQHSIPDAFGVRVTSRHGSIMCTGDFRFDYSPIGNLTDFSKLEQIGKEDLTILLSDSTNAMRPMHSPSESDILKDIEKIISEAPKKVIITAFASNLIRMKAIIELAAKLEKKVVVFGRSMVNGIQIGRKHGYIEVDNNVFLDKKRLSTEPDNKIVILTTGSQGEPLAALARMAEDKHPQVKIKHNDTVLFSSSPIPGNRMKIELLINRLYKQGAIIKENGVDGYLHTSGHAYQEEHDKVFQITKPKYFLPYHGEYRMAVTHGQTAIKNGVKPENVFIPKIGQVFYMENRQVRDSGINLNIEPVLIENNVLSKSNYTSLKERQVLGEGGFVNVIIAINKKKNSIIGKPRIISRGTFYVKKSNELIEEAKRLVHGGVLYHIKNNKDWSIPTIKQLVIDRLQPYFYKTRRRKPLIITSILFVEQKNTTSKEKTDKNINNKKIKTPIHKKNNPRIIKTKSIGESNETK